MKLYLVRHTQVDVQPGTCYGQTDVPVLASFPEEAQKVKERLTGVVFDYRFSSPLTRCRKLAESLVGQSGEIRFDNRLKELHFGIWEGQRWSQFEQTFDAKKWFGNFMETPCPDGESYFGLIERIRSFLEDLSKLPDQSTILIVSHGGPIRAFLSLIVPVDPHSVFDINIDYGEVVTLNFSSK